MTDLDYLRIIKWVLIVLLAGFIGQFGKTFAKHLMEKTRLKKKGAAPKLEAEVPPSGGKGETERGSGTPAPPPFAISPEEHAKQEKKLAKGLVKQKKKESKALKKQAKS